MEVSMDKIEMARELFAKLEGRVRQETTLEDAKRKFRILEMMNR
jgi:hypothetical protein